MSESLYDVVVLGANTLAGRLFISRLVDIAACFRIHADCTTILSDHGCLQPAIPIVLSTRHGHLLVSKRSC